MPFCWEEVESKTVASLVAFYESATVLSRFSLLPLLSAPRLTKSRREHTLNSVQRHFSPATEFGSNARRTEGKREADRPRTRCGDPAF